MSQLETTVDAPEEMSSGGGRGSSGGGASPRSPAPGGGLFAQYKAEQGRATRAGTCVGGGALVAWGAYFLYDQLGVYEGDEGWRLLVTTGIPILFAVVFGGIVWWLSFVHRKSSDFMIATEGEMKKVSWSSKREVIGSTKVVILFTVLMAAFLFVVDVTFQSLFSAIGALKR